MEEKRTYEHNNQMKKNESLYRSLAVSFGLSECAFWILYVLRSNIAMLTQRDLCDWLCQPKQSVNTGIKKLLDKGLIELTFGDDRRSKYLILTGEGKAFCEKTVDRVIDAEKAAITGLSGEEKELLLHLFGKYTELLDERFSLILEL